MRQLHELGALEVTLIGGEAYLREDWVEIAAAIRAAAERLPLRGKAERPATSALE